MAFYSATAPHKPTGGQAMHICSLCSREFPSKLAADRCCGEPPRWDDDTWQ